jgi:broad specificity phosphatase PhoE
MERMIRRGFLLVFLLLVFAGARAQAASSGGVTTVFLVRHAEKNPNPAGGDAGLTAKGQLRAHDLARVLGDTHLDAVYSTSFGRARMTAQPVADAEHDSVTVYDPEHPERLAETIRTQHAGGTVLVVGHGDTVPATFEALTGKPFPEPQNITFDRLYVLFLTPTGEYRFLKLRYGAPSAE